MVSMHLEHSLAQLTSAASLHPSPLRMACLRLLSIAQGDLKTRLCGQEGSTYGMHTFSTGCSPRACCIKLLASPSSMRMVAATLKAYQQAKRFARACCFSHAGRCWSPTKGHRIFLQVPFSYTDWLQHQRPGWHNSVFLEANFLIRMQIVQTDVGVDRRRGASNEMIQVISIRLAFPDACLYPCCM